MKISFRLCCQIMQSIGMYGVVGYVNSSRPVRLVYFNTKHIGVGKYAMQSNLEAD